MDRFDHIEHQVPIMAMYTHKNMHMPVMSRPHIHDSYEIYLLTNGERMYFIEDKTYHVKQGGLVMIKPNVIHRTIKSDQDSHERLLINFTETCLDKFTLGFEEENWLIGFELDYPVIQLNYKQLAYIQKTMTQIYENLEGDRPSMNYVMLDLMQMLLYIKNIRDNQLALNHDHNHSDPIYGQMEAVVQYINEHYSEQLTLTSLADQFFFSPYYLSRSFKKATGFNVKEYINQVRIISAERLLEGGKHTMASIADQVGFESQSHFGRVFKQYKGMSATQFKKRYRES